ncbi:DUF4755 domain-containing protein [Pseudoduganella sp. FT26W]|uniref:DUF4755 domain-containing protein n=2 Tax=Duganella aquatilis TaxID=2666082 RepID=A0A844CUY1_9BURK|nr:DUF4755 domain-containing protein [Duganella aquatilis]
MGLWGATPVCQREEKDMGFFATIFALWGLFFSIFIPAAPGGLAALGLCAFAWGPMGLLVWFALYRAGQREKLHREMLGAVGVPQGTGFDHAEEGTGIALSRAKRQIGVLVDGVWKIYPYDDIRKWAIQEQTAGRVVGGLGVANNVAATGANARMAREASANTGLFLTVKDLQAPQWRVAMKEPMVRARWMELLQQEINEGGVVNGEQYGNAQ